MLGRGIPGKITGDACASGHVSGTGAQAGRITFFWENRLIPSRFRGRPGSRIRSLSGRFTGTGISRLRHPARSGSRESAGTQVAREPGPAPRASQRGSVADSGCGRAGGCFNHDRRDLSWRPATHTASGDRAVLSPRMATPPPLSQRGVFGIAHREPLPGAARR